MTDKAPARRCVPCDIDWPDSFSDHATCYQCGAKTRRVVLGYPLSLEETESRKKHIDFDAFYAKRGDLPYQAHLSEFDSLFTDLLGGQAA